MPDTEQALRAGIRTPDQRLRVFVSSTLGDLTEEREAARTAIEQLRLAPIMFEAGARPHPAQDLYRAYLEQSDVFVGIYWQGYGWVGPDMTISGLEDEFLRSEGLPRLLYVKQPAPDMEPGLRRMLGQLRAEGRMSYKAFADAAQLHDLLLDDLAALLAEHFSGDAERDGSGYAIPASATGLVGRDHDVRELARLIRAERHRVVVLTGAGGIGKTRLALAVLERTRRHWRDGVAFVDLSPVSEAGAVAESIASALGFVGQGNETPVETLRRRLTGLHMLLVIDNFEQVLEAAPVVGQLLERSPELHVLVTSRVVLRLRGEREWRVEPLRLSPAGSGLSALASTPAVQMFVERVRDVRPGFELTEANAAVLAELCRRLDGLPLALELAASWMRLLSPDQVLERLDQRMERPGRLSDLPDRQQTLRATLGWSYELLPESARQILVRLSVFAAPFTAESAEAVCGRDGTDVTESLATLFDHSMITPAERPDGEPAFRLLEVIRAFAAERLEDREECLRRLERYMVGVLETASPEHGSQDWARRLLDSEDPNLAIALQWAAQQQVSDQILRRLGDVWVWSLVRGNLRRTTALRQQLEAWPAASLRNERDQMARSFLQMIGSNEDGRWAELGAFMDRILPDARRIEEPSRWGLMLIVRAVARPYEPGSPAGAELAEALAATRAAHSSLLLAYAQSHYGNYLCVHGDVAAAKEMHEECLRTADARGDDNLRAEALYFLALDYLAEGDPDPAHHQLEAAARYYTDIDHRDGLTRCMGMLSSLALYRGDPRLAARLAGATAAARDEIGLVPWPEVAEAERRVTESIQDLLPAAEYAAETAAGKSISLEIAIVGALASLAAGSSVTGAGR
jgi:predicted ATPase